MARRRLGAFVDSEVDAMRRFEKHVLAALGLALLLSVSGWLVLAALLMVRLECCLP